MNRFDLSRAYLDPLTTADTGVLINVASLLGFPPIPYISVYGATKTGHRRAGRQDRPEHPRLPN